MKEVRDIATDFLEIRPKLAGYLYRLTTNKQDMEDLLQETFLRVSEKINSFRGESSFLTWVFSIATNLAKDHQRVRNRWSLDAQDKCKEAAIASEDVRSRMKQSFASLPEKKFELAEHMNYCFTCIAKNLNLEQQIAIVLKEVYDFDRKEIAAILNVSEGSLKHILHNGRKELQTKFENRCALINKTGACYQCAQLNDYFEESKTAEAKIAGLRLHPENTRDENFQIRLNLIKQIDPVNGNGAPLHETLLQILQENTVNQ